MTAARLWLVWFFFALAPIQAQGVGFSLVLSNPRYSQFESTAYAYSTLFPQGRDGFHWLDLSYSDYDYVMPTERGRAQSLGTSYRFSHRLRWSRYFKPFVFSGVGANQVAKTGRIRVERNHNLVGRLSNSEDTHYVVFLGGGYLWQRGDLLIGFSLDYAYDNGYGESFWSPLFLISMVK